MATGIQQLIVLLVALNPVIGLLASTIIAYAYGSSIKAYFEQTEYNGLGEWDMIATLMAAFLGCLITSLSLYFGKGLAKNLTKFASTFNAKLKNLVTPGKNFSQHNISIL